MTSAKNAARLVLLLIGSLGVVLSQSDIVFGQGMNRQSGNQASAQALLEVIESGALERLSTDKPGNIIDGLRQAKSGTSDSRSVGLEGPNLGPADVQIAELFCRKELTKDDELVITLGSALSSTERDYCRRAGSYLSQAGYGIFTGEFKPNVLSIGAVQDSFVLGIGDLLVVTFVGEPSSTYEVSVDREGRVILPSLRPITAAGLTLGQFKQVLQTRTGEAYIQTEAFVSIGSVREFGILVAGEVRRPGLHRVTSLSSVINAIGVAGGIKKTGTLRGIRVLRQGVVIDLDLYGTVFGVGEAEDIPLLDGDKIVVPMLGGTVAVVGDVRRPTILEIAPGQSQLASAEALNLAGGPLRPRGNRFVVASFNSRGQQTITPHDGNLSGLSDGDILIVIRGGEVGEVALINDVVTVGRLKEVKEVANEILVIDDGSTDRTLLGISAGVELIGHVREPGRRAFTEAMTIGSIIGRGQELKDGAYPLFAVLATKDSSTLVERFFGLPLGRIVSGQEDYQLRDGDKVMILGREDVAYLNSPGVRRAIKNTDPDLEGSDTDSKVTKMASTGVGTSNLLAIDGATNSVANFVARSQTGGSQTGGSQTGGSQTDESQSKATDTNDFLPTSASRCRAVDQLRTLVNETLTSRFSIGTVGVPSVRPNSMKEAVRSECRQLYERFPSLLAFVLEHTALISGEVRRPGLFPTAGPTSLGNLIDVAGGATRIADKANLEVSRQIVSATGGTTLDRQSLDLSQGPLAFAVKPGDVIRLNAFFIARDNGPVELFGEVRHPGAYTIRRGEKLSELLARAGGLTSQAYPFGSVFTRERVKAAEKRSLGRLARELTSAVAVAAANQGVNASAASSLAVLAEQVRGSPVTGRVVIEADPTVLQVRPELDIVLEPGDKLYVPKRPNSILVTGDVLNPGAMQFVAGRSIEKYIEQSGGFKRSADRQSTFIIFPNGAANPISVSVFKFTSLQVPPGSTIVVPKDAAPLNMYTIVREAASLIGQLALTAASLAVISDN